MLAISFFQYFTDPVLRAPMIGSILMCLSAALVGVIVFLKRQSLIGEALSHAAYPGVVLGMVGIGLFFGDSTANSFSGVAMLGGAFIASVLGMRLIYLLENRCKVNADAALCFTLSFFFGIGITIASHMQFSYSNLYRQTITYFYGQAATMTDIHIAIYSTLAFFVLGILHLFRKEFKAWIFDPVFSEIIGINSKLLEILFLLLITLSVVIGIRSVGVVLMSAMLIAPAAAARQCTSNLKHMFLLAGLFGMSSAAIGTYLANELSSWEKISLPTGPMIVLTASFICILALLFAKERGLIMRLFRILKFRSKTLQENLLKALWRNEYNLDFLKKHLHINAFHLKWVLFRLQNQGWIKKSDGKYTLTSIGRLKAERIVRLHRLWEVYLADYVGLKAARVHSNAEEMEHVITPELEQELSLLLNNPRQDPHHQPIPKTEGL